MLRIPADKGRARVNAGLAVLAITACLLVPRVGLCAQLIPGLSTGDAGSDAQASEALGEPSPNDVRELMRLLSDERMTQWLERQATPNTGDSTAMEEDPGLDLRGWLGLRLAVIEANALRIMAAWADPGARSEEFRAGWAQNLGEGEALRSLVYVIVFLIIGAGLEWLHWRYAWHVRRRIETAARAQTGRAFSGTLRRAALDGLGIALFAGGTLGGFLYFQWTPLVEALVLSLLLAVVTVRVINSVAVFVLCPHVAALRPLPIETPMARFLYWWLMSVVVVACVGGFTALAGREMSFIPRGGLLVSSATATLVALMLIAALWHWRARAASAGARRDGNTPRVSAVDIVPVLGTLLVVVVWVLWLVEARALMWTLIIAVALPLVDAGCRKQIRALGERAESPPTESSPESKPARHHVYAPVLDRFVRFALVVGAVLLLGTVWGIDLVALSASSTRAGRMFEAAVDLVVALLIADLIWVWAKTAIDARLVHYKPPEPGHAPGPEARLATLLPLIRKVLMVTLLVMIILIGLSSLGINVGPLLAGAGVVGIAVGLGAQTLVRDIVSGVFFLFDDAFRVGEYIEVGDLRGTVESISIRSLRLRHHRGAVHTVPFGEMKSLTNHSRDWVIMKLELRVPFDTDLKLVKKLVKQIGQELQEDEELGPTVIEPLKSQGVRRMEEFNMVVGVKFMAKPGEQWVLRKEAYQRIRDAFDRHGITFAERNVKVEVVGGEGLSPEVREAAVGAAQSVIEQQVGADGANTGPAKR